MTIQARLDSAITFLLDDKSYRKIYDNVDSCTIQSKGGTITMRFEDTSIIFIGKCNFVVPRIKSWKLENNKINIYLAI